MTDLYEHRDFYLGAYLIAKGCELISHKREDGLTTFAFSDSEELRDLINEFYDMNGDVDALTYSSAIRSLKTIIHSNRTSAQSTSTSTGVLNNEFNNKREGNE